MGHRDVKTTRLYIEYTPTSGAAAVDRLAQLLSEPPPLAEAG